MASHKMSSFIFAFRAFWPEGVLMLEKYTLASGCRIILLYSRFVPVVDWRLSQKRLCVNFLL